MLTRIASLVSLHRSLKFKIWSVMRRSLFWLLSNSCFYKLARTLPVLEFEILNSIAALTVLVSNWKASKFEAESFGSKKFRTWEVLDEKFKHWSWTNLELTELLSVYQVSVGPKASDEHAHRRSCTTIDEHLVAYPSCLVSIQFHGMNLANPTENFSFRNPRRVFHWLHSTDSSEHREDYRRSCRSCGVQHDGNHRNNLHQNL